MFKKRIFSTVLILAFIVGCSSGVSSYKKKKRKPKNKKKCDCPSFGFQQEKLSAEKHYFFS